MKKSYLFLLSALVALNLLGCTEELEQAAILLDEVDSVNSDSLGKDEYENLYGLEFSEIDSDIESAVIGDSTEVVEVSDESEIPSTDEYTLDIDGTYTTAEDVALYIHIYEDLPDNFMTKSEARELGWTGGGLEDYAQGMCIGGDRFGNYEGLLPKGNGRIYTECDINTLGENSRGAERIVFSNDGLIYYTDDHYESFVLLYEEDGKAE